MTKENQNGIDFKHKERVIDLHDNEILEVAFFIKKSKIIVCKTSYGTYRNVYINEIRKLTLLEKELI